MKTLGKQTLFIMLLLVLYAAILLPFTDAMKHKPFVERLGYIPQAESLKFAAADQREFIAASLVMKVLFYFGSLMEKSANKVNIPPDYLSMYNILATTLKIDPYNMDAYYFSQAIFVWDAKRVREANAFLEYGMKYRTWDWYLPFWAGFNYAYFLKDYEKAAKYYKRAAELTGNDLYANLTGRYLYEAGQTGLAISYLETMLKSATNEAIKKTFRTRLTALRGVDTIEKARDAYKRVTGKMPVSIDELVTAGYLPEIPQDPYGGIFYLENDGKAVSTSKFSFAGQKSTQH